MKLATLRTPTGTRAVRVDADGYRDLGSPDLGTLLAEPDWQNHAAAGTGATHPKGAEFAPLVPKPGKIVCVGLNYRTHILEMGRDLPQYPTLFAKFADSLIGAGDAITLPPESEQVDWEAELAVIIGTPVRRADAEQAEKAIAGFTVCNDVTTRDWQYRTKQWLQGKTFDATTPLGPVMVTPNELDGGVTPAVSISTTVNGETMQKSNTSDLVFGPVELVRYLSTITTLNPGDIIATGTPGGVGHARTPPRYLTDGTRLITDTGGIGTTDNTAKAQP